MGLKMPSGAIEFCRGMGLEMPSGHVELYVNGEWTSIRKAPMFWNISESGGPNKQ